MQPTAVYENLNSFCAALTLGSQYTLTLDTTGSTRPWCKQNRVKLVAYQWCTQSQVHKQSQARTPQQLQVSVLRNLEQKPPQQLPGLQQMALRQAPQLGQRLMPMVLGLMQMALRQGLQQVQRHWCRGSVRWGRELRHWQGWGRWQGRTLGCLELGLMSWNWVLVQVLELRRYLHDSNTSLSATLCGSHITHTQPSHPWHDPV